MRPSHKAVVAAVLALASCEAARAAYTSQLLYQFPDYLQWVENMAVRPNGNILITTFDHARVYELDPSGSGEAAAAAPRLVAELPDADASIGIAEIAPDVFAVEAGRLNRSDYHLEGTGRIDTLDFSRGRGLPAVRTVARYPQAVLPNGLAALPLRPRVLLSADSVTGTVYRVDTDSGAVDVALRDPRLAPSDDDSPDPFIRLLGVNGLKVHRDYLYVSSSSGRFLARVRVDELGTPVGGGGDDDGSVELETLVRYPTPRSPDDFFVARNGTVFGAVPLSSVSRVTPDGDVAYIVDCDDDYQRPTAVTLSRDETTVYVSTGGRNQPGGKGGQIFAVRLE